MKPNIFVYRNFKNEDHFTNSLGYLLNLFPTQFGNRFVSKLSTSTGNPAGYLGKFKEAEFIGYNFQNENSTSKPDLIIHTDKFKLFFEIKLTAPLSASQLERHLNDVKKAKGKLILISNVRANVSKKVIAQRDYLKPLNHDHFFWTDFEPIFNFKFRKNSLGNLLLSDFQKSLRSNDIKARQILGAEDNLYTIGSKAEVLALKSLSEMLKNIGFKVWRVPREHTIRVYPQKIKVPPLINPIFSSTGEWISPELIEECLIAMIYFDNFKKSELIKILKLEDLELRFRGIKFFGHRDYDEAAIYIPLIFKKRGKYDEFDWNYLKNVWQKIYNILK